VNPDALNHLVSGILTRVRLNADGTANLQAPFPPGQVRAGSQDASAEEQALAH
jgi:hypothetical protein